MNRTVQSDLNRTDGLSAAQPFQEIQSNIARLQLRKDEHIGTALEPAEWKHLCENFRTTRGVPAAAISRTEDRTGFRFNAISTAS